MGWQTRRIRFGGSIWDTAIGYWVLILEFVHGSDRNLSRNGVASLVYICANAQDIGLKHYCALDTIPWGQNSMGLWKSPLLSNQSCASLGTAMWSSLWCQRGIWATSQLSQSSNRFCRKNSGYVDQEFTKLVNWSTLDEIYLYPDRALPNLPSVSIITSKVLLVFTMMSKAMFAFLHYHMTGITKSILIVRGSVMATLWMIQLQQDLHPPCPGNTVRSSRDLMNAGEIYHS